MTPTVLSLAHLAGRTGRHVRIAVVDSGIHAGHSHVGAVAGGIALDERGGLSADFVDRLGHGTAVAAAIREKAPEAALVSVRVFDRTLATSGRALVSAIRWAADDGAALINLSLGTTNAEHELALVEAIAHAAGRGSIVVAAAPTDDSRWLPGALPGVVAVGVNWDCPRDRCTVLEATAGVVRISASGLPRPLPGVRPERNLHGQSFAVANATGLLALVVEGQDVRSLERLAEALTGMGRPRELR